MGKGFVLRVEHRDGETETVSLPSHAPFTIGRSTGDLVIDDDDTMSGMHAVLVVTPIGFQIDASNSRAGVLQHKKRFKSGIVEIGQVFALGATKFAIFPEGEVPKPKRSLLAFWKK